MMEKEDMIFLIGEQAMEIRTLRQKVEELTQQNIFLMGQLEKKRNDEEKE